MTDEVPYLLPFGWIGKLSFVALVRRDLDAIPSNRTQVVRRLLGAEEAVKAPA